MTAKQIAGYLKAKKAPDGISFNDGYNKATYGITKAEFDEINRAMHAEYGMFPELTTAGVRKALKPLSSGGAPRYPLRGHATKKSSVQLQREINEALAKQPKLSKRATKKYHLTPSSPKKLFRFTKSELEKMPTISEAHFENLKAEGEVEGIPTRWWLSRMTVEDGETNSVHVEQLIDGRWQEVHKYGRADAAASRNHAKKKKPTSVGGAHQKWNVYSGGKLVTSVFYVPGMEADDVRRGLINHDGYPADIRVRRAR